MINEEIQLGKKFTINSILDIVKIEVKLPIVEKNKFNDCIEIKFIDDELQAKVDKKDIYSYYPQLEKSEIENIRVIRGILQVIFYKTRVRISLLAEVEFEYHNWGQTWQYSIAFPTLKSNLILLPNDIDYNKDNLNLSKPVAIDSVNYVYNINTEAINNIKKYIFRTRQKENNLIVFMENNKEENKLNIDSANKNKNVDIYFTKDKNVYTDDANFDKNDTNFGMVNNTLINNTNLGVEDSNFGIINNRADLINDSKNGIKDSIFDINEGKFNIINIAPSENDRDFNIDNDTNDADFGINDNKNDINEGTRKMINTKENYKYFIEKVIVEEFATRFYNSIASAELIEIIIDRLHNIFVINYMKEIFTEEGIKGKENDGVIKIKQIINKL